MSIVQTDCQHCQTGTRGTGGFEQPPEQAHFMASSQAATEPSEAMSTLMNTKIKDFSSRFTHIDSKKVWGYLRHIALWSHDCRESMIDNTWSPRVGIFPGRKTLDRHSVLHCTLYFFLCSMWLWRGGQRTAVEICERAWSLSLMHKYKGWKIWGEKHLRVDWNMNSLIQESEGCYYFGTTQAFSGSQLVWSRTCRYTGVKRHYVTFEMKNKSLIFVTSWPFVSCVGAE